MNALLVIVVLIVLVVIAAVVIYNRLVALRNRADAGWSQIDVQLQRRHDLIPNLVETVKGYAKHEDGVFQRVTEARAGAINAQGPVQQAESENMLSGALKSLFAVSEAYPELKANQNFLSLQEELAGTEGRVAYARQFYNEAVNSFNTALQQFPGLLFAGRFTIKEFFEIEGPPETRNPVQVQF